MAPTTADDAQSYLTALSSLIQPSFLDHLAECHAALTTPLIGDLLSTLGYFAHTACLASDEKLRLADKTLSFLMGLQRSAANSRIAQKLLRTLLNVLYGDTAVQSHLIQRSSDLLAFFTSDCLAQMQLDTRTLFCQLIAVLSSSDPQQERKTVSTLIEAGVLATVTRLLSDDEAEVRRYAAEAHRYLTEGSVITSETSSTAAAKHSLTPAESSSLRHTALIEILETEKTYVEVLLTITTHFLAPLMASGSNVCSEQECKQIFSISEQLAALHTMFLSSLQRRIGHDGNATNINIGDLFCDLAGRLKLYKEYINNYGVSAKTLAQAIQRESFRKFLDDQTRLLKMRTLSLSNCLITPIQRIPRYKLLLTTVLTHTPPSHPDFQQLTKALLEIQSIADFLDSENQKLETLRVIGNIISDFPLDAPNRLLLNSFRLSRFDDDAQNRATQVYVFSDIVVYAASIEKNVKEREMEGFETKMALSSWFPLSGLIATDCDVIEEKERNRRCHVLQLTYFEQQVLLFGSPIAKKRFLQLVRTAQHNDSSWWNADQKILPVKVYIPQNIELKPLGLNDTHRTLALTAQTTARETRKQMITKMCKAMSSVQIQTVSQECVDHRVYIRDCASEFAFERVMDNDEYPLRYLAANASASLVFKPYPPRQGGLIKAGALILRDVADDGEESGQAAFEEKGFLRVHLPDNIFLRQLGFENTFKTLDVNNQRTAAELEDMMREKMCKGMTEQQKVTISKQCQAYHLHWVPADSKTKIRVNPADKPFKIHKTIVARDASRGWRLFFLPVGVPHFSRSQRVDDESSSSSASAAPSSPTASSSSSPASAIDASTPASPSTLAPPSSPEQLQFSIRRSQRVLLKPESKPPPPLPPKEQPLQQELQPEKPEESPPPEQTGAIVQFDEGIGAVLHATQVRVTIALTQGWQVELQCDREDTVQIVRNLLIARLVSSYSDDELKQLLGLSLANVTPHFIDQCGAELFEDDIISEVYQAEEVLDISWY